MTPSEPKTVLAEVRRILDEYGAAKDAIRMIRRLLDPPREQRRVELTERRWPVFRSVASEDDGPEVLR